MADDDDPTFAIPTPPERRYPRGGGVEYEGETVFSVRPTVDFDDDALAAVVESVLDAGPYRYGDWFDLPMPLYLVHDDDTGDTFRVAVRDGAVEFHVLPATDSAGLRGLYRRLTDATDSSWSVTRKGE
ncbi:hypothetical protein KY092_07670 [Natronomonas gomsonensis]|uniref:hypothetical protein n=1 Tax=Natronomonas gomsonensis TaxID=1046043 RepID=UPI0020CA2946|nr:hypothetical protein [Natronomonas gomsonensis]MCY4730433.1 hypothetical protein [Natronomonas gomsonensis]